VLGRICLSLIIVQITQRLALPLERCMLPKRESTKMNVDPESYSIIKDRISLSPVLGKSLRRDEEDAKKLLGTSLCFPWRPVVPWWSWTGSNRRPQACKARALPAELQPLEWWACVDLNHGPPAYQADALTS
jgi:hypothetical protein